MRAKRQAAPTWPLYKCVESLVRYVDGDRREYYRSGDGKVYAGSHPAVKAAPHCFEVVEVLYEYAPDLPAMRGRQPDGVD